MVKTLESGIFQIVFQPVEIAVQGKVKLLKLDPGNTEPLAQKQRLLKDAISETKDKLATLKEAAEKANEALANGEITQEQYDFCSFLLPSLLLLYLRGCD